MSVKLTIHRGAKQVGGSCVEVSTASTRVILDVGLPLDDLTADRSKEKRKQSDDRETLLRQGVIPNVKGMFGDKPAVDAILLSHAHADHSGLLVHADPSIPIHLSKGTSKMLMAGSVFAGQPRLKKERTKEIKSGQSKAIGDMRITAYAVDLLFNGDLPRSARCIYSYWHGYLEKPEWRAFRQQLAGSGGDFVECHTSGHIFADDIVKFVKAINPRNVVPIHTFTPEEFKKRFENALLLEDGQTINV